MTLIEFISLDISTEKGVTELSSFVEIFLETFLSGKAPLESLKKMEEVIDKTLSCIQYYNVDYDESAINDIKSRVREMKNYRMRGYGIDGLKINAVYDFLYDLNSRMFNEIKAKLNEEKSENILNKILDTNNYVKHQAKQLILEAIIIIDGNAALPNKAKLQIIEKLTEAVTEIDSPSSSWSKFLGKLKEATIVLAAIVAISGYTLKDIIQAKTKIDDATNIIENTVINNISGQQQFLQISNQNNFIADTSNKE